jgi:hypothetical protein
MKKFLYRLESSPQAGVYSGGLKVQYRTPEYRVIQQCRDAIEKHFGPTSSTPKHPCPCDDTKLKEAMAAKKLTVYDVFFGFSSIDQMRSWFYSDSLLLELDKIGVTIVCYEVNDLLKGNAQAVAISEEMTPKNVVWRISPEEFLNKGISNLTPPTNPGI